MKNFVCLLFFVAALTSRGVEAIDDFNANSTAAASVLQQSYNDHALWDTTGWWNAANCLEAIEDVCQMNNGAQYLDVISHTFKANRGKNFLNVFYDDEGWWALAWIRAYDITGKTKYLKMSKTIFKDMTTGWTAHCDGGLQWKKDQRYKNAIPNELFLLAAIQLHQRTAGDGGPGSYFEWAANEWNWFKNSGMINAENLVNDGLTGWCANNKGTTWSYNQGVVIGGLVELYKTTGDTNYLNQATAIADAVMSKLVDSNGVLSDPCEEKGCGGEDIPQFKGIFIRYFASLYDVTRKPEYLNFLYKNAHFAWAYDRDAFNHFGLRWSGPIDKSDAARQSSAMFALTSVAEPVTSLSAFAKTAGSSAFNHEVGAPSGTLAWTCSPANTKGPGFMQTGPFVSYLPAGRHVVHFRMSVDAFSESSSNLVRIDVRELKTGTLLAARDIAWRAFSSDNQDFNLIFTNAMPGDPLEFRVFWNGLANAPALTLTDITVDGSHNWTAANMRHEIGRLDRNNAWEADPVRDRASGFLGEARAARELASGKYIACFELKIDNFNWDRSKVATLSVVDTTTGKVLVTRDLKRRQFPNALYQAFPLKFKAISGHGYEFRTFWRYAPHAPRLTHRCLVVKER